MGRLENKAIVVTGGASGIGRALVDRFLDEGAAVLCADQSSAEDITCASPERFTALQADVTSEADARLVVETALARWGRLDGLCNCAGIQIQPAKVADTSPADFRRVMDVNVLGIFLMMRAAIPTMLEQTKGAIVNLASIGSFIAQRGFPAYYASKGACLMLTRAAAVDYADCGIRVNAICPGVIETPMLRQLTDERVEPMKALHPVGRFGQPEEIAAMAVLLMSDECTFATGSAFVIDGGRTSI